MRGSPKSCWFFPWLPWIWTDRMKICQQILWSPITALMIVQRKFMMGLENKVRLLVIMNWGPRMSANMPVVECFALDRPTEWCTLPFFPLREEQNQQDVCVHTFVNAYILHVQSTACDLHRSWWTWADDDIYPLTPVAMLTLHLVYWHTDPLGNNWVCFSWSLAQSKWPGMLKICNCHDS